MSGKETKMKMDARKTADTRQLEYELAIDAAVEDVWKALTDGRELTRWFPTEARVTPGEGGVIHMGWQDYVSGDQKILVWDPPRHLRTTWFDQPAEGGGDTVPIIREDPASARRVVVDYFIETKEGRTVLRLVHSGFSARPEWDDEFDSTRRGWRHELGSLKHYLETHRGRDRRLAWARRPVEGDRKEIFRRVMSPGGLPGKESIEGLGAGDRYRLSTPAGEFAGVVLVNDPPDFAATVDNRGDSVLRVMVEACGGTQECHIWLGAWTLAEADLNAARGHFEEVMARLFPAGRL